MRHWLRPSPPAPSSNAPLTWASSTSHSYLPAVSLKIDCLHLALFLCDLNPPFLDQRSSSQARLVCEHENTKSKSPLLNHSCTVADNRTYTPNTLPQADLTSLQAIWVPLVS